MRDTRQNKSIHFSFLKSINIVIIISLVIAVLLTGVVALIFNAQNKLSNELGIIALVNVFLVSSPLVIFIVSLISFAIFTSELAKHNVGVNKYSRFESLSKIEALCLEKENVIVDGTLTIKKIIPLKTVATEQYINQWVSNVLRVTNDKGSIFDALNKQFDFELSAGVVSVLNYNDVLRYSGASFKGGKTIVIGNPEFVPVKNKVGILKRCEEDINKGCRILVIAEGKDQIGSNGYLGELEGIALIVLKDHIREGAFETFKWFKNNNIDIKVISSDNALVTSVNAAEAGIEGADKYISLAGIELERIENLVSQYTIFGDASSEQKEAIISTLKKQQKVMMIGGSESDISAMKVSNFAVVIANSDDSAQKEADIIIDNPSLESLPLVVEESKIFMNNMQKILSMSLAKTFFAFVVVLFFTLFNSNIKQCLFVFNHLLLWDLITNGVISFLFIFDKKNKKADNDFFKKVLRTAIPMAILQIIGVLTVFILFAMENNHLLSLGLYSVDNVAVVSVLLFVVFGVVALYNISVPLNKNRKLIVVIGASINVLSIAVIMLIAYLSGNKEIPYLAMNVPSYFATAIIAILYSSIYLSISRIISIVKGDNLENEN